MLMSILNIQINFIYGWGSLRSIKVFVDDVFQSKIDARGFHSIKIPSDAKKITFTLGVIKPYRTTAYVSENHLSTNELFVGLYLHHRSLLLSFYDSLKKDYLRGKLLTKETFNTFSEDIYQQEVIELADRKIVVLTLILSVLIFVFSIVQQQNDWAPLAFLLSLSTMISTLVHFNDKVIEKLTFKTRVFTAIASFILSALFLENSFLYLRFIIVMFTLTLFSIYLKEVQNREVKV